MNSPSPAKRAVETIAATLLLLCFAAPRYDVALDGAESAMTGFPLPWFARLPGFSLATEVYVVPLFIDMLFGLVAARYLVRYLDSLPRSVAQWCCRGLIAAGCATAIVIVLPALILYEVFYSAWPMTWPSTVTAVQYGGAW